MLRLARRACRAVCSVGRAGPRGDGGWGFEIHVGGHLGGFGVTDVVRGKVGGAKSVKMREGGGESEFNRKVSA